MEDERRHLFPGMPGYEILGSVPKGENGETLYIEGAHPNLGRVIKDGYTGTETEIIRISPKNGVPFFIDNTADSRRPC